TRGTSLTKSAVCRLLFGAGMEPRRVFRSVGRVALAVGMGAGAGEMSALHDEIFLADRTSLQKAFEDFSRSRRVTRLRRQRSSRNMRSHPMVRQRRPRMIARP